MESDAMKAAKVALQVVCAFTFVGNILVVVVFAATKPLRIKHFGFVFNLAVTDVVISVMVFAYQHKPGPLLLCLTRMSLLVAELNVLSVAVSRLISLSVVPPARYDAFMTRDRMVVACLSMWTASALIYVPMAFNETPVVTRLIKPTIAVTVLIFTGAVYFVVFSKIARYTASLASSPDLDEDNKQVRIRLRQTRHLMVTFIVILATSVVCWLPITIGDFMIYASKRHWWDGQSRSFRLFYKCSVIVVVLNSAANPFIYWWRIGEIREGLYRMVRAYWRKQTAHQQLGTGQTETMMESTV